MATDLLERVRAELDARLAELRPAVAEYERLTGATDALGSRAAATGLKTPASAAASAPRAKAGAARKPRPAAKPRHAAKSRAAAKPRHAAKPRAAAKSRTAAGKPRAARKVAPTRMGPGEQAIVAALEHGSHTVGELGIVTAMSGAEIRDSARRLLAAGRIVRAKREGRAAYARSATA
jgi:hypothetical protein